MDVLWLSKGIDGLFWIIPIIFLSLILFSLSHSLSLLKQYFENYSLINLLKSERFKVTCSMAIKGYHHSLSLKPVYWKLFVNKSVEQWNIYGWFFCGYQRVSSMDYSEIRETTEFVRLINAAFIDKGFGLGHGTYTRW